jgi:hypothetical protein
LDFSLFPEKGISIRHFREDVLKANEISRGLKIPKISFNSNRPRLKGEGMRRPFQKYIDGGRDLGRPRGFILTLSLLLLLTMLNGVDVSAQGRAATITSAGTIVTRNGTAVPPFPKAGRWTEFAGKSSDHYETRHFMYIVPNESPAIELYLTTDKHNGAPDGVFEMGLVKGFVGGFTSKAGFNYEEPVFGERKIGTAKTQYTSVSLSKGRVTLWVHAYVYPGKPSLTFIAVTGKGGMQEDIEKYLSQVELK